MSTTIEIATNIIGPIFIIVAIAIVLDRTMEIDARGLSRIIVYVFTPFLIFEGVANSDLGGVEVGQLVVVAFATEVLVAVVAWGVARLAGFDRKLTAAFVLSSTLINAGNYGLPLSRFAFGAEGEARALIFFVITVVISYTLGVFLASLGTAPVRRALLNVVLVPLPYAVLFGLIVNVTNIDLALPIARAVGLLADATIPAMLVVLGLQLSRASIGAQIKPILLASGMRLLVAPLLASGLVLILGMSGLAKQVSIVQAAMPTAVISGVLATEYDADAEFVTATILISTLASIGTLSWLLSIVM